MAHPPNTQETVLAVDACTTHCANDIWVREEPFLAPERAGNTAKALVDGKDAMAAIASDLKRASKYIYITDWAMNPHIPLVRDGETTRSYIARQGETLESIAKGNRTTAAEILAMNPDLQLRPVAAGRQIILPLGDTVLSLLWEAAEKRNVKVRVILWDSADKVGGVDNYDIEAEDALEAAHPNIRVSRHSPGSTYWSHHQKSVVIDGTVAYLGGIDLCDGRWDDPTHPVIADAKLHRRTDFYNPCIAGPLRYDFHPRMPWHDVHLRIDGPAAHDVELSFVQRWNYQRTSHKNEEPLSVAAPKPTMTESGGHKIQIVRSVHSDCIETNRTECSIYHAYLNAISGAQHYIYIENQFFTSNYGTDDVTNRIAEAIAQKVTSAIDDGEPFKVVIVLPAHPEGVLEALATKEIMHYQYQSIGFRPIVPAENASIRSGTPNNRPNGLLNRIANHLISKGGTESSAWTLVDDYVSVYSLHNHALIGGRPVHEQVYVHAKTMIVDDRIAIIGSANINDRSQLGERDSELAAIVQDSAITQISADGTPVFAREFAHQLRKRLWSEHIGETNQERISDPYVGYAALRQIASSNTTLYESVFPDFPSDRIADFRQQQRARIQTANLHGSEAAKLSGIRGQLCLFPLLWLYDEKLHRWGTPSAPFTLKTPDAAPGHSGTRHA